MSKYKLLLADDSITIQKVVNLTFADEGIEVISVGDGNSALEKFSEFTPDLVMADINMPGLSGYEICERIKQNEQTRQIPVILLVGSFEPFDENRAHQVGADDYLTKPFQSIRQLVNKVSTLLESVDRNAGTDELTAAASDDEFDAPEFVSEENYQAQVVPGDQLGDAGMDDEMIQTNQGGFAFDEMQKFSSKSEFQEDYGKTQPLSAEELNQFNSYPTPSYSQTSVESEASNQNESSVVNQYEESGLGNGEDSSGNENTYQSDEYKVDENSPSTDQSEQNNSSDAPSPDWDLDDMNLLELPPRRTFPKQTENTPPAEEMTPAIEARGDEAGEAVSEPTQIVENGETEKPEDIQASSEETQEYSGDTQEYPEEFRQYSQEIQESAPPAETGTSDDSGFVESVSVSEEQTAAPSPSSNLSESDIDAIAQKVAEKISDRVVRELVPQLTDLLVRRMAEERLKE